MAEPYLGEIRILGFDFAPQGWAACDGQTMQIMQNQALYALLGIIYGGNGTTTFCLPDFRGRVPMHFGSGISIGQKAGEADHTLLQTELPAHTHTVSASNSTPNQGLPANNTWAGISKGYGAPAAGVSMGSAALGNKGTSQSHSNMQPYVTLNFVIALWGIFPSRN